MCGKCNYSHLFAKTRVVFFRHLVINYHSESASAWILQKTALYILLGSFGWGKTESLVRVNVVFPSVHSQDSVYIGNH